MYFSTYFPLSLWGDVAIFLFWFGWGFVELADIVAYVFHDTAWTLVKPQWRLFKAFGGGRGRIQANLVRIQLDLSFRVVFSRIWGISSRIWGVSSWVWGCWKISMGCSKISIGALDIFNGGIKKSNGGIEKGQCGDWKNPVGVLCRHWSGSMGAWRKGQRWHWKGSMGALVRVNGGIEKGQWGHWSGSTGVLKRVNGGVGQGQWGIEQWGLNGGIEKDEWGHWSGSMAVLKRANGVVGQGQWRHWEGSGQTGAWLWVRQGCGCGSDRRLSYGVVSSTLQGCKLYLAGLQALPCRVVSSTLQGCKLYLAGL